jgi:hypothetical protein
MAEMKLIEPEFEFWTVTIEEHVEDSETGKVKKQKTQYLVDAVNATDVDKKVNEYMKGTMWDWKIISIQKSKVTAVF